MDNYNGDMIIQLLALSGMIYSAMEAAMKGTAWRSLDRLVKRLLNKDQLGDEVYAVMFRVMGIVIGILTAWITPGISFLGAFGFSFADNAQWLDVVTTGIMLGLGERAIHFVVDTIFRDNWKTIAAILKAIQANKENNA